MGWNNYGGNSCCKDCVKRTVGCHSNCKEYAKFKKEYYEMKSKISQEKMKDGLYRNYKKQAVSRMINNRCSNGIIKCGM